MNSNTNPMTAQIPSGFAMPVSVSAPTSATTAALCGTAMSGLGAATVTAAAAGVIAPVYVVRERLVTGDADAPAIRKPFPGPTAWSPPTS